MMRFKSQSLPETDRNKQDFNIVAEGQLELSSNAITVRRSNSALPQSNQEIRSAGKQSGKNKGAKRWKLLRLLTLATRRRKSGDHKRKRAGTGESTKSTTSESEMLSPGSTKTEFHFVGGKNNVHKITITKPTDDYQAIEHDEEECLESEKRIMWDEATIIDSPCRKISTESQYSISNRAISAAVNKWKASIRPATPPAQYETGKEVPRRKGVCEELEKSVISDGTNLHELRKDLTVYLTLDELGML